MINLNTCIEFQNSQYNFDSLYKKHDPQFKIEQPECAQQQILNHQQKNEKLNKPLKYYEDGKFALLNKFLINNYNNWYNQAQQSNIQRQTPEEQKQYENYLFMKQENIKNLLKQRKLEKQEIEKNLKQAYRQRAIYLQRLYYNNLLHNENVDTELGSENEIMASKMIEQ